jgi:hypothetical protein
MVLSTSASAVLFQSSTADYEDFQKYALQRNQHTYTQWIRENETKSDVEAHPQILEFSQQALKEGLSKQVLSDWDLLRHSIDLNKADREVLTLLAEKLHHQKELCRYVLLNTKLVNILEDPNLVQSCQQKALPLPQAFYTQLQAGDLLAVDGNIFTKSQLPQKLIAGTYQWVIISDQYEDRRFVGTAEEFSKQKIYLQSWVSGGCKEYKLNHKDFNLLLQSQVYFNDTCVNPGIPPEKNFSSWASDHKGLLWGLGILATALTASQLRDKTLVITRP